MKPIVTVLLVLLAVGLVVSIYFGFIHKPKDEKKKDVVDDNGNGIGEAPTDVTVIQPVGSGNNSDNSSSLQSVHAFDIGNLNTARTGWIATN